MDKAAPQAQTSDAARRRPAEPGDAVAADQSWAAPVGHGPTMGLPGLRLPPRSVLALQRVHGNQVVQRLLGPGRSRLAQRCGGEVHEGCSCAEGKPQEEVLPALTPASGAAARQVRRFTDGTPEAPSPDLPDGSQWAGLPGPVLDVFRRTLAAKSYWRWANSKPTNLGAALDLVPVADINTVVQLYKRLEPLGLWTFIGRITTIWSTSSLGINFDGTGNIQAALPEDQFCKDTAIGESYHKGKSCWREMVPGGTPGLHVCLPGEIHIDPHQAVAGKATGWRFGGAWGIEFVDRCSYALGAWLDHMRDVEGGRPVNVFTRRGQLYGKLNTERERLNGMLARQPELGSHTATLDSLQQRLDALGTVMQGWAIRGFEGNDASAEAKAVFDELDAIEAGIGSVEDALDVASSPGANPRSRIPM